MERYVDTQDLLIGYRHADNGRRGAIFSPINVSVGEGEVVALLGRNGIGKSTFLRTLTGMQKPLDGQIYLCEKPLPDYTSRNLAAVISFVPSASMRVPYLKLFDLVALGRFPYTGWMGKLSADDELKVFDALTMVGLAGMEARNIDTLSDGERQRAVIARALVQDTPIVILDEPTAFLDMPNKYEIVQLLCNLAHHKRKAIIFSTHELSLAQRMADCLWVMTTDGLAEGTPNAENVAKAIRDMFTGSSVTFEYMTEK